MNIPCNRIIFYLYLWCCPWHIEEFGQPEHPQLQEPLPDFLSLSILFTISTTIANSIKLITIVDMLLTINSNIKDTSL